MDVQRVVRAALGTLSDALFWIGDYETQKARADAAEARISEVRTICETHLERYEYHLKNVELTSEFNASVRTMLADRAELAREVLAAIGTEL